jgi:hypothetical protein
LTEQTIATGRDVNGLPAAVPLPKRGGPKGMMPSTWTGRGVRVEYRDASGRGQTMSGKLLDTFPVGIVVGVNGCRQLFSWDALVSCELDEG